jgi:hypothetical protein
MLGKDRGSNITKPYKNSVFRKYFGPIPVAAQSEARRSTAARLLRLRFRIPPATWML